MINTRLIYITIIVPAIILMVLALYPNLDIKFSQLFYTDSQGFVYRNNFIVLFFFQIIPIFTKIFITSCIVYLLYKILKLKRWQDFLFSTILYLVVTGLIGPGLIVNHIFKENFGRARPVQIVDFNGSKSFSRVLAISNQCHHNCSFSSGHAAMAYYFTALAYALALYNSKKLKESALLKKSSDLDSSFLLKEKAIFPIIYIIMLLFGSVVGFSRILMGGHFLSDVIASCLIVLSVNYLLYLWWQKQRLILIE